LIPFLYLRLPLWDRAEPAADLAAFEAVLECSVAEAVLAEALTTAFCWDSADPAADLADLVAVLERSVEEALLAADLPIFLLGVITIS
jgi:hypothetical protein